MPDFSGPLQWLTTQGTYIIAGILIVIMVVTAFRQAWTKAITSLIGVGFCLFIVGDYQVVVRFAQEFFGMIVN